MNNIADIIRNIASTGRDDSPLIVCTVDSVDTTRRTIDCTPLDEGAPLLDVNLQANQESKVGVVQFPRKGSMVIVAMNTIGQAAVVLAEDVETIAINIADSTTVDITEDGIVMNGGELGGMIKIQELTDKVNELVDKFNNHTHIVNAGIALSVETNTGTGTTTATGTTQAPSDKAPTLNKSDYENEKVKH